MSRSILVIGSVNMDLVVSAERLPVPGENIRGKDFKMIPGGKGANQAVGISKLGARASMAARVGQDVFGEKLIRSLEENGVEAQYVKKDRSAPTGTALIVVQKSGENSIIVVGGANRKVSTRDIDAIEELIGASSLVVMQFEIPMAAVERACKLARKCGTPVLIDAGPPAECPDTLLKGLEIISPNEREAELLTKMKIDDIVSAAEAGRALLGRGVKAAVLKLGEDGCLLVTRSEVVYYEANKVWAVDTTAAGDAFTAALAVSFAGGSSLSEATRYANYAGAFACTRFGAQPSMPTKKELDDFIGKLKTKEAGG